jgi:hypothetical protein
MIQCRKQRLIVILAGFSLLAALLFPPWLYTFNQNGNQGGYGASPAGYSPLFWAPSPQQRYSFSGVRIDTTRLLLECASLTVATALAFLFATMTPPTPRSVERQDKPQLGQMEKVTPQAIPTGKPSESSSDKMPPFERTVFIICVVGFVVIFLVWALSQ